MGWLLNRKVKKVKELVERADFSVEGVDTFKFNDWFEYQPDSFWPNRLSIYWRNRKNMSDLDKEIIKIYGCNCSVARSNKFDEYDVDDLANNLIYDIQCAIKRYCKIREALIDEPYLKNYSAGVNDPQRKYSTYVKLTPFTAMNYLADVEKHHSDWEQNILTEYRNYIKRQFIQASKNSKLTGDYPPIDAWAFITWHFNYFLPELEAKGRTMLCQGFIDEVETYREALASGENKEKKDKKDKK